MPEFDAFSVRGMAVFFSAQAPLGDGVRCTLQEKEPFAERADRRSELPRYNIVSGRVHFFCGNKGNALCAVIMLAAGRTFL